MSCQSKPSENFPDLESQFIQVFGSPATHVARAPGRVNLIGEHTDYNRGLTLPMAIDPRIELWFRPRADEWVHVHSVNYAQTCRFSLEQSLHKDASARWADYLKGVAHVLRIDGHSLRGWDGLLFGNIPVASGLSSSAALEVATLLAMNQSSGIPIDGPVAMAQIAQRSENEFVGVQCGLMDQLVSVAGKKDHALWIDFDDHSIRPVEIPDGISIVIGDTRLSRELASSVYNTRRSECEIAVARLREKFPARKFRDLRDITPAMLRELEPVLDPTLARRIRHVVTENERVQQAVAALKSANFETLGQLFNASHDSLRVDYEVSSEGLDLLVHTMRQTAGCYGARLTGAGFGGCTIALVEAQREADFVKRVTETLHNHEPTPRLFPARASAGASVIKLGD